MPLGMLLTDLAECFKLLPTMDIPKVSNSDFRNFRVKVGKNKAVVVNNPFLHCTHSLICQNEEIDFAHYVSTR